MARNDGCFLLYAKLKFKTTKGVIVIRTTTKNMVLASLFAGLMAVCAWICVPVSDIAFTMQTFSVFLVLLVLGGKWGTVSIGIYLLLGFIGMPVFSGFRSGPGVLLGVTGGYLWGFLSTGLCFWCAEKWGKIPGLILGLAACYVCGSIWFLAYSGGGLVFVLMRCVVPYVIPDLVKLWLAAHLAKRLKKYT